MRFIYKTKGTCSIEISFNIDGKIVTDIVFKGGCDGNLKTISMLINGWTADDIIKKCS